MSAAVNFWTDQEEQDAHSAMAMDIYLTERELGMRSFRDFQQMSWPIVEPGVDMVSGWGTDALTDHAQALAKGEIEDLLVNIPPRRTKSTIFSVQLPAWIWTWAPSEQIMSCSYGQDLAERDSRNARQLIQSDWYQKRWGDKFKMLGDQNAKKFYQNDKNGSRQAVSVEKGTGKGGNVILVDDPHNVFEAESEVKLKAAIRWWGETMSTRGNNPLKLRRGIIMQRIGVGDLSDYVLREDEGWVHLNLPSRYQEGGKCIVEIRHSCSQNVVRTDSRTNEVAEVLHDEGTPIGFKDPRKKVGELLDPVRFPEKATKKIERGLGEHATRAQMEQAPGPRSGGMFMVDRLVLVKELPPGLVKVTRGWDKAATHGDEEKAAPCSTAGVKLGRYANGRFIIIHVHKGDYSTDEREAAMLAQATLDGIATRIVHEQEPGSGGLDSARDTSRNLAGFNVSKKTATGSKVTRANPFARAMERGDVDLLEGEWNQVYLDEMRTWPAKGRKKDQGDASAVAYNDLALGGMTWSDLHRVSEEDQAVADAVEGPDMLHGDELDDDYGWETV